MSRRALQLSRARSGGEIYFVPVELARPVATAGLLCRLVFSGTCEALSKL